MPNLRKVSLDGLPSSPDLSFLPSRLRLTALRLYHGQVSDATLKNIGECPSLKELSLTVCGVDGSGIRHLSGLGQLETLSLEYTNVTSEDLAALGNLKQLRELDLTNTKINGKLQFLSALENLETLKLYGTRANDADLASLIRLPHLRSLDLGHTGVGADEAKYLHQMKQLKRLRVFWRDDDLEALRVALPGCEVVCR